MAAADPGSAAGAVPVRADAFDLLQSERTLRVAEPAFPQVPAALAFPRLGVQTRERVCGDARSALGCNKHRERHVLQRANRLSCECRALAVVAATTRHGARACGPQTKSTLLDLFHGQRGAGPRRLPDQRARPNDLPARQYHLRSPAAGAALAPELPMEISKSRWNPRHLAIAMVTANCRAPARKAARRWRVAPSEESSSRCTPRCGQHVNATRRRCSFKAVVVGS